MTSGWIVSTDGNWMVLVQVIMDGYMCTVRAVSVSGNSGRILIQDLEMKFIFKIMKWAEDLPKNGILFFKSLKTFT